MAKTNNEIKREAGLYLGTSEALRNEQLSDRIRDDLKSFDVVSFVNDLRGIREITEPLDMQIMQQKENFGFDDVNRENIEKSYALKMDLLYNQAYAIHPLTSFGRKCLEEAVNTRKEFEELVGGYTTRITRENIKVFRSVLTTDLAEDIISGRRDAIGAIRAKGIRAYGAGVLAYHVDEDPDGAALRIDWLYVHPDFRGRRIADSLIAEIIYQVQNTPVNAVAASFTVGESWEPVIGSIFSKWKFVFGTQMEGDTIVDLGDIVNPDPIEAIRKKYGKEANPLSEIKAMTIPAFLRGVLMRDRYRGYLWGQIEDPGYFDPKLSCYVGDLRDPDGLMLVHRTPSGMLRVEYAGPGDADEKTIVFMAVHVLYAAIQSETGEPVLDFPIRMDVFEQLMEKIVPEQRSALLVTAVLADDNVEADITEETVSEMLSMPDEELRERFREFWGNL